MNPVAEALPPSAPIAVIGAGAMGAGIGQIAAASGHPVWVHDLRPGAAENAIAGIRKQFDKLREKGKLTAEAHAAACSSLRASSGLQDLADCALLVEAIVENLEAKRSLFGDLEKLVGPGAILATNTSSISVTSIGATLQRPERLVGMHFFNPAPLMPLVEVIRGMATDAKVADTVFATAARWGKTPVHAKSTPGFIVNRVARPFYAEGLRLLQEGVADHVTLDAIMRESGGFKMGPFELMDLIGHDVNYAVTRSVFEAYYNDSRFMPSVIQLELVNAGFLGRKSGRGFYDYRDGATKAQAAEESAQPVPQGITILGSSPLARALSERLEANGVAFSKSTDTTDEDLVAWAGVAVLSLTDGRSATRRARDSGIADLVLIDLMLDPGSAARAAVSASATCNDGAVSAAIGLLQAAGFRVSRLQDSPGMAVMRTVAMLANEACDAVHQQVCSVEGADLAMRGGVGYPIGPLAWADRVGVSGVIGVLDALVDHYGEPRYRASALLRQREWAERALHA